MRKLLACLLSLMVSLLSPLSAPHARPATSHADDLRTTVIEHVTVIPMTTDDAVLADATVVIERGRIVSLNGPAPKAARRINGRGKWLIPGLMDMHVHLPSDDQLPAQPDSRADPPWLHFNTQDIMTPYIANGVTQILNMDAVAASVGQRNQVESGEVLGPHMALAAVIDAKRPQGRMANTPSDARQAVRDVKAEGYNFVKVYFRLDPEPWYAIMDEARKQGMKVVGHIPNSFEDKLEAAFVPGFSMVAHAEEFSNYTRTFTNEDATRFARLAKKNESWVSPTLVVMRWIASQARSLDEVRANPNLQYVHPLLQSKWIKANSYNRDLSAPKTVARLGKVVAFHRQLVRAFKAEGVPLVAGSDTLASGVVAGFSLHEELELLAGAGLTNVEVLASATRLPALWLGVDKDRGTIEPGKRADLVLLNADPRADIRNTRNINGVFLSGRWLSRKTLDAMMADLAKRNTADRDKYDWNRMMAR
jgi:imidazolonepropionase-like amidohydrolase